MQQPADTARKLDIKYIRAHELSEVGGPRLSFPILFFPLSPISLTVSVDVKQDERKQSSGAVWTGSLAYALIPCPILPPSLTIGQTVSVDVKHRGRRINTSQQICIHCSVLHITRVQHNYTDRCSHTDCHYKKRLCYGVFISMWLCLTSTETIRLIRDREKEGKGVWRWWNGNHLA